MRTNILYIVKIIIIIQDVNITENANIIIIKNGYAKKLITRNRTSKYYEVTVVAQTIYILYIL